MKNTASAPTMGAVTNPQPSLVIFTVVVFRGKLRVSEYVDVDTGEIISASVATALGVRTIRPDAMQRRLIALDSLRREPRCFAEFLLKFRNQHGQFLVSIDELVGWYARLTDNKASNVRRYFKPLIAAGVLDDDLMLAKDFMILNPKSGKGAIKGGRFRAYRIFDGFRFKGLLETEQELSRFSH